MGNEKIPSPGLQRADRPRVAHIPQVGCRPLASSGRGTSHRVPPAIGTQSPRLGCGADLRVWMNMSVDAHPPHPSLAPNLCPPHTPSLPPPPATCSNSVQTEAQKQDGPRAMVLGPVPLPLDPSPSAILGWPAPCPSLLRTTGYPHFAPFSSSLVGCLLLDSM